MRYCSSRQPPVQGETGPSRRHRALSVTSAVALSTFTLATYGGISTAQNLPASSGLTGSLTISEQAFTAPIIAPVISAFQKQNPNLHVTASVQGTTTTTYTTVLLTEKLAGDLQDIVNPADVEGPSSLTTGSARTSAHTWPRANRTRRATGSRTSSLLISQTRDPRRAMSSGSPTRPTPS